MRIIESIVIEKPVESVWKILAEDFDQAYVWMSPVFHSYALDKENQTNSAAISPPESAPVKGRVCQLSQKPNGLYAEEFITRYDAENKLLAFDVTPKNAPKVFPIRKTSIEVIVTELDANRSKVEWACVPEIKPLAKVLSPLLKVGLAKSFAKILKELKVFAEGRSSAALSAA